MNLNIVLRDPKESHCDSNLCDEIKILYNIFWDDNLSHANPLQCLSLKCGMNVHFWTECCFGNFIDSSICYYLSRAKFFQRKLIKNSAIISIQERSSIWHLLQAGLTWGAANSWLLPGMLRPVWGTQLPKGLHISVRPGQSMSVL